MPYSNNSPAIDAAAIAWEETGDELDPKARLSAHVRICGVNMHLEAWATAHDDALDWQTVNDECFRSDLFEAIASHMECPAFETATIGGREYILFAAPYSA